MTYLDHTKLNKTYYEILGVEVTATSEEIRTAYKEKLLATHPDKKRTIKNGGIENEGIKKGDIEKGGIEKGATNINVSTDLDKTTNKLKEEEKEEEPNENQLNKDGITSKTSPSSAEIITSLKEAYQTLIDERLRREYDIALTKTIQREGFNINGDGLDVYDLSDFNEIDDGWAKDCPRCTLSEGIVVSEDDLEEHGTADGMGGYDIIAQCSGCSLWIQIKFYEVGEE